MKTNRTTRTNRLLIAIAAAIGVLAGVAGIAAAVTGDGGPGPSDPAAVVDDDRDDDERDDGDERDDRDDDLTAEHAAARRDAATVTQDEAEQAALAEAPGTVHRSEIEEEDGRTVWDVEVDGEDDRRHEVQVDAESGAIVEHDTDDD